MNDTLIAIATIFSQLSLLAFGGGNTILPEMQRQVVDVHHWMSAHEFTALFALAQAAPGPNMMIVSLVGWHVAGSPRRVRPWRRYVQQGLMPVTAGLVAASAVLIAQASNRTAIQWGITAVCAVLAYRTRIHPLWLLAGGALIGLTGFGQ